MSKIVIRYRELIGRRDRSATSLMLAKDAIRSVGEGPYNGNTSGCASSEDRRCILNSAPPREKMTCPSLLRTSHRKLTIRDLDV